MLKRQNQRYYKVQKGQTLSEIAEYFSVAERLLVKENGLTNPPFAGQILRIPTEKGNAYTVREGDTKALLCGNEENYFRKNGTDIFYIGMKIRI
jgi:LysM repeat protein